MSWFENLPKDEQPPRHIWWSEKLLSDWFEEVRENRSQGSSGSRKSLYEQADDAPMMESELVDREKFLPTFEDVVS